MSDIEKRHSERSFDEKASDNQIAQHGDSKHIADPEVMLDAQAERRMYRKVDVRLVPILALLYLVAFLDRGNIGNARLAGLEKDLHMNAESGDQYAIALTLFFITYNLLEVPAAIVLKLLTPKIWLSSIIFFVGISMIGMGLIRNVGGLYAMRLLLGAFEAGLFPGATYLLSLWYPRSHLQFRIALFFSAATIAGAFSGLLAYGIQFMNGIQGYSGWRWIFILEGLFTSLCGAFAYFFLLNFPETAHFLSPAEREWAIWRKATDGTSAGEHVGVNKKLVFSGIFNLQIPLATISFFSIAAPLYSLSFFLPTIINSFGKYSRPQVQLLTVPVYVFACLWVLVSSILADKWQRRFMFVLFNQCLMLVGLIINITTAPQGVKFFGLFLIASGSYGAIPSVLAWLSSNLRGQTKRAVGVSFQIGLGNFGGVLASNVYRKKAGGRFFIGHGANIGVVAVGICTTLLYAAYLRRQNSKRDAEAERQAALPPHQRTTHTIAELHDLGDLEPSFRYVI